MIITIVIMKIMLIIMNNNVRLTIVIIIYNVIVIMRSKRVYRWSDIIRERIEKNQRPNSAQLCVGSPDPLDISQAMNLTLLQ